VAEPDRVILDKQYPVSIEYSRPASSDIGSGHTWRFKMRRAKGPAVTLAVLSAILGLLLAACQSTPRATNERSTEPMATAITVRTSGTPPLDLAAPPHTETATFALG
jgi:hypothetical protein